MYIHKPLACVIGILTLMLAMPDVTFATIAFKHELAAETEHVIDVRPDSRCMEKSVPRSTCLPVEHLLSGENRLANFSGLFWLLGTMGLVGNEHIAIIGDKSHRREFIAGWLFVAGQSKIDIITQPVSSILQTSKKSSPGRSRGATRTAIYTAHPRTNLLVLKPELITALKSAHPPTLLDGRAEGEYWGWVIKATRGGHLPGAIHEPLPTQYSTASNASPVAYAHDSVTGLAYLARLTAQQIDARLFLGGWVQWAWDGSLPVDAESYPTVRSAVVATTLDAGHPSVTLDKHYSAGRWTVPFLTILLAFIAGAYWLGHSRRNSL